MRVMSCLGGGPIHNRSSAMKIKGAKNMEQSRSMDRSVVEARRNDRQQRPRGSRSFPSSGALLLSLSFLLPRQTRAWGNNDDGTSNVFAKSLGRDWLTGSKYISMKVVGCVWSYTTDSVGHSGDGDDNGCMEQDSDDADVWYQMSNCRKANVAYSLYSDDSCSTFEESFHTKQGLSAFIEYSQEYDPYSPFGDDDQGGDDDGYNNYEDLPQCEQEENGYYLAVGCAEDGTFTIESFSDQYCLYHVEGGTYDTLDKLNSKMSTYTSCQTVYNSGNGDDAYDSMPYNLIPYSESCSSLDSELCTDDSVMESRRASAGGGSSWIPHVSSSSSAGLTLASKAKYALGSIFFLASFIMFMGILFTNRRKRRALMQRKLRQSSARGSGRSRSKSAHRRSKSRSRSERDSRRSSSSRRSRSKSRSRRDKYEDGGGVFT